jgi:predicted esterase
MRNLDTDPHHMADIMMTGSELEEAQSAIIMLHGRGSSAGDILTLTSHFNINGAVFLAPEAYGNSWYPQWFMSKLEDNQPNLDSAIRLLKQLVGNLKSNGIPPERILLLGFSQGACLVSEFAVRNAQRYGGIVVLSGGLMGPEGTTWEGPGSLEGSPVYIGCSDVDPFIPLQRVLETGEIMQQSGGQVTLKIFRGMGHLVNQEELEAVSRMIRSLV